MSGLGCSEELDFTLIFEEEALAAGMCARARTRTCARDLQI